MEIEANEIKQTGNFFRARCAERKRYC